jgi:photosystem II stability/assembly factor-like uncharacterized protein
MKNLIFLTCLVFHCHSTFGQTPILYISKDQGENWEPASDGLPPEGTVNAWTTFGNTLVAGTRAHGIYLSDRNLKWYRSPGFPKETKVNALFNYRNKLLLAGTTGKGIFVSADGGEHWHPSSSALTNLTVRCFYTSNGMLLAGTDHGVFASWDETHSWKRVTGDLQINTIASNGDRLYVATQRGLMFSADQGDSWSFLCSDESIASLWTERDEIIMMDFRGHTLHSIDRGLTWLRSDVYLPDSFTFRLTPGSAKFFVAAWQGRFKMLSGKMSFGIRCYGLPERLAFMLLLNTPFGILASAGGSGDGC